MNPKRSVFETYGRLFVGVAFVLSIVGMFVLPGILHVVSICLLLPTIGTQNRISSEWGPTATARMFTLSLMIDVVGIAIAVARLMGTPV